MDSAIPVPTAKPRSKNVSRSRVAAVTIRFAGDSGDGMQLAGTQFSDASALVGNDISTLPDYPAEIRAPAGTLAGVSGYQLQFASTDIYTPGDEVDTLVAMNPAALKTNLGFAKKGALILVNEDAFDAAELKKANYAANPLDDGSLSGYRVIRIPIDRMNAEAVKEAGLTGKQAERCKNFFTLGLVFWLYDRPLEQTLAYIEQKFRKNPAVAKANTLALKAGYNFGETTELMPEQYVVEPARLPAGTYRKITGNEAVALGLVTAARLAGKRLFYGSYPITPASTILETLADMKNHDVVTFQAEDEIAAMGSTIGAAFGGAIAATGTSGPGMALKTEAIGLAVMTELPVVIVDVQRGGPSTGLPTKTEQSDLYQAVLGRNGDCPVPVIAATSPSDCFDATIEATRIAVRYMTPVILLTDGYIGNSSEPWRVPEFAKMRKIEVVHPQTPNDPKGFMPYRRDEDLARPWALPGTKGLEHRVGGLEKQDITGGVSHDPKNHQRMTELRAEKVARVRPEGPTCIWTGPDSGDVLLVGWGGTHGTIKAAVEQLQQEGMKIAACQLRYIHPLPDDLGPRLKRFPRIVVCELNYGQLRTLLRAQYLIEPSGINKIQGQPFTIGDIVDGVHKALSA
jgi:2-oxoglutarate/2-oxoacid ferredoxin oxidoreductase subunit alpha